MSNLVDLNPFGVYNDLQGRPLQNGKVYIGLPNQDPVLYPAQVYWDSSLTIPAPQPLRTIGGYVSRNGTPAKIYIDGNYSLKVTDQNNKQIFYVQDYYLIGSAQPVTKSELASSSGSSLIGFINGGSGSVLRTVSNKLSEFVSVKDFGAKGDGVTDDTAAFNAAIAYAKLSGKNNIYVPAGAYNISSRLTISNMSGFCIFGDGANYFFDPTKATYIRYTGTTGSLIGIDSCNSFEISDIWFGYNSNSYNGELVWTDNTAGLDTNSGTFIRCVFGGETSTAINASDLLRIKKSYQIDMTECLFIRGLKGVGIYAYANIINFTRCQFQKLGTNSVYAYTGSLESINFYKNTFEPLANGKASAFDSAPGVFIFGFTYNSNWHGDVTTANGLYWVRLVGGRGVSIIGNTFGSSGGGSSDYAIYIGTTIGAQISGNVFYEKSLNFISSCQGIFVSGNSITTNPAIGGYSYVAGNSTWSSNAGLPPFIYRAKIYLTANQSIPNNINTAINFAGEFFNSGSIHSNSTNPSRFTIPTNGSGLVNIGYSATLASSASGNAYGFIMKNGGSIIAESLVSLNLSNNPILSVNTIDNASDGDYYEFVIKQSSGGALNVIGNAVVAADTNGFLYKIATLD